eukprot:m.1069002 g.1069002  ORF g.1069002 m.1069002 type:complete len:561 (-) comp24229_c0_seq9:2297-3979(-)
MSISLASLRCIGAHARYMTTKPQAQLFCEDRHESGRRLGLRLYAQEGKNSCPSQEFYDVAIVGAGVVGLAVAREAACRGARVVVFERGDEIASGASSGNSGLGHTGYDAPRGSLEERLLRHSIQRHAKLYKSFGLTTNHVRGCGSLVVAWDEKELQHLGRVLEENRAAGDADVKLLTQDELRVMEPALSDRALGAVLCPWETVVEPWLLPVGYAQSALMHGAEIKLQSEVVQTTLDRNDDMWTVTCAAPEPLPHSAVPPRTRHYRARAIVNCGGLYGDVVEQYRAKHSSRGQDKVKPKRFTITPRKGQFAVFKHSMQEQHAHDLHHIIEPVPTAFTKGVLVWKNLYGNIVVGPTAVDQASRTDRTTDTDTIKSLRAWGEHVFPALQGAELIGTYSGLRPATEHRDYQIYPADDDMRWITVGGIRSTGVSAAAGIALHVATLLHGMLGSNAVQLPEHTEDGTKSTLTAFPLHATASKLVGVSEAARQPLPLTPSTVRWWHPAVPSLETLAHEFQTRGDGKVELYGREWRVTHPLSIMGLKTMVPGSEGPGCGDVGTPGCHT